MTQVKSSATPMMEPDANRAGSQRTRRAPPRTGGRGLWRIDPRLAVRCLRKSEMRCAESCDCPEAATLPGAEPSLATVLKLQLFRAQSGDRLAMGVRRRNARAASETRDLPTGARRIRFAWKGWRNVVRQICPLAHQPRQWPPSRFCTRNGRFRIFSARHLSQGRKGLADPWP